MSGSIERAAAILPGLVDELKADNDAAPFRYSAIPDYRVGSCGELKSMDPDNKTGEK